MFRNCVQAEESSLDPYNKSLHWFSVFVAICTFFLIIAGGLVTSTGSGLAVPDWPLSYGQLMPPMVGGILYEHSHRMIAAFVGLLTIILTIWIWKKEDRRWMRILALIALLAVITQGVLGGLTVLFLLPTPISVGHATLAQMFFSLVAAIALFTSRWWLTGEPKVGGSVRSQSFDTLCIVTTVAVYVQLILGALVRHTYSGLAVPDFPLAYGQIFPSLSPESVAAYNDELYRLEMRTAVEGAISSSQILIHMLHRICAVVVLGLAGWTFFRLRKLATVSKRIVVLVRILLGMVMIQAVLGGLTVLSRKAVEITTAHVAVGALLLACSVLLTLHAVRVFFSPSGREAIA